MLTQLRAFQALTLQWDLSFISSSFAALSFSLSWYNSQSGTSTPCHRSGGVRDPSPPCSFLPCQGKPGPPPPGQGLGALLLRGLAAARGLAARGAARQARNLALALRNLVKLGTEALDHLFLFWKLVETAISKEGATGVPEAQKYFHLIIQPGTVGLIKFLCLRLCSYTCLEMLQLQKALRKSFHLIKTGNVKPWRGI